MQAIARRMRTVLRVIRISVACEGLFVYIVGCLVIGGRRNSAFYLSCGMQIKGLGKHLDPRLSTVG